jgi:3-hydroxyacyl-CoA dehydrogenase/3-hydroxy-2-methylbutyryl-CoA dehydrogenase
MKNLVTLITGGLSGLGLACVNRFRHQLDTQVIVCDLPTENRSSIPSSSLFLPTDISSELDVRNVFDRIQKDFGRLDVLVNCAGIILSQPIYEHSFENFNRVLDININGTYNMIQQMIPLMINNGVIINVSSVAAFEGRRGQTAYAASKGAIAEMTRPLAEELAPMNIRVCGITPGAFDTPLLSRLRTKVPSTPGNFPLFPARLGNPDEFAQLVQTIVENPLLNGINIRLDALLRMPP